MLRRRCKKMAGLLLAVVLGWSALFGAGPAQAAEPVGEVVKVRGAVVARHDGAARQIAAGHAIYPSDVIATSDQAKARIRFTDGTVLTLGSGSSFEVSTYLADAGQGQRTVELSPFNGIFRAAVAPFQGSSSFDVDLQFSVASVRSTVLLFEVARDGCAVLVHEGQVAVRHKTPALAQPVLLSEGEGTDVKPDQPPTAPKPWGAARVEAFLARTAFE